MDDDDVFAHTVVAPYFDWHFDVRLAHNVPDGLDSVAQIEELRAAIVDLDLPGGTPFDPEGPGGFGFEVVERVRIAFPDAPVVVLSAHIAPRLVNTAQRLGAEYMVKSDCRESLELLAQRLLLHWSGKAPAAVSYVERLRRDCDLSMREAEVLLHVLHGRTHDEIAQSLWATVDTIKLHEHGVLRKTRRRSMTELVRDYLRARRRVQ